MTFSVLLHKYLQRYAEAVDQGWSTKCSQECSVNRAYFLEWAKSLVIKII